jgi:hypothetical protein
MENWNVCVEGSDHVLICSICWIIWAEIRKHSVRFVGSRLGLEMGTRKIQVKRAKAWVNLIGITQRKPSLKLWYF